MADLYKKFNKNKKGKSPSGIAQDQHHDTSGAQKNAIGSPATYDKDEIYSGASVTTGISVAPCRVIRVFNTNAAVQYLYVGPAGDAPGGAPDITTGMALAPGQYENLYLGELINVESIFLKGSSGDIQLIVMEE